MAAARTYHLLWGEARPLCRAQHPPGVREEEVLSGQAGPHPFICPLTLTGLRVCFRLPGIMTSGRHPQLPGVGQQAGGSTATVPTTKPQLPSPSGCFDAPDPSLSDTSAGAWVTHLHTGSTKKAASGLFSLMPDPGAPCPCRGPSKTDMVRQACAPRGLRSLARGWVKAAEEAEVAQCTGLCAPTGHAPPGTCPGPALETLGHGTQEFTALPPRGWPASGADRKEQRLERIQHTAGPEQETGAGTWNLSVLGSLSHLGGETEDRLWH